MDYGESVLVVPTLTEVFCGGTGKLVVACLVG